MSSDRQPEWRSELGGLIMLIQRVETQLVQLTNTFHTDREMSATSRERIGEKINDLEKIIIEIKSEARNLSSKVSNIEPHVELWRDSSNQAKGFWFALVIIGGFFTAIVTAGMGYVFKRIFG